MKFRSYYRKHYYPDPYYLWCNRRIVMAQSFPPPSDTSSKVELSISCSNLKNLDYFSKSDPVVFLYTKSQADWVKVGRTEVIENNLNPKVSSTVQNEW